MPKKCCSLQRTSWRIEFEVVGDESRCHATALVWMDSGVQHNTYLWTEIIAVYNSDRLKVHKKDACGNAHISLR